MAKTTVPDTVVVIDDEMHNMIWMLDYIESKGLKTIKANTADEAVSILEREIYRAAIIDLNIPIDQHLKNTASTLGAVYLRYPGLFVAHSARNRGYRDRQVVIYSVHKDAAVSQEVERLRCTYVLKGRPREIKLELDSVIAYDPTSD